MSKAIKQIEYYNRFRKYLEEGNAEELATMIESMEFDSNDWEGILQMEMQNIPFEHMDLFENSRFKTAWFNYIEIADFQDRSYLTSKLISNIIDKTENSLKLVSFFLECKSKYNFSSLICSIIKTAEYICADNILIMIADILCERTYLSMSDGVMVVICEACYQRKLLNCFEKILNAHHKEIFKEVHFFSTIQTAINVYKFYYPDPDNEEIMKIISDYFYCYSKYQSDFDEQLGYVFSLGIKTAVVNNIIPLLQFNFNAEKKTQIIDLLNDNAVLYVQQLMQTHLNNMDATILLLQMKNKSISVNIDDFNNQIGVLYFKNSSIKKLFSSFRIVAEQPLKDNHYLNHLAKNNSEILYLILDNLDCDDSILSDIVSICINNKNVKALEFVNSKYQKKVLCE